MVPDAYANFFVASASAGAALVGLLFVSISIAPHSTVKGSAPLERQASAGNAFTALITAFFISLGALIPGAFSYVALVMSVLALVNTISLGRRLLKHWSGWQSLLRRGFLVLISLVVYAYEGYFAARLINFPAEVGDIAPMASVLMGIYGLGLIRAWELLGARRYGLAGWLSLLQDVEDEADEPPPPVKDSATAAGVALPQSNETQKAGG